MTEPVKMWAVVRDDGGIYMCIDRKWFAEDTADDLSFNGDEYTVKPCEVRIIEDDQRD